MGDINKQSFFTKLSKFSDEIQHIVKQILSLKDSRYIGGLIHSFYDNSLIFEGINTFRIRIIIKCIEGQAKIYVTLTWSF